jgi:predicted ATPase/DNA-binding CsgD family transcriptional regulator
MRVSPAPPRGPAQARPHDLPAPLTRLIGREAEVRAVCDALLAPEVRLLTLVGAPGIGKTRLALAVARALVGGPPAGADRGLGAEPWFADGVVFVPLAPLRDPMLVVSAIAQAVGVREAGGQSLPATLQAALRARQLLLVLDNCEHLPAAAPSVAELLAACPGLTVLATSRAPLHLYGEHEYPVPPLVLPDLARLADPQALARVPAVALLVERARAVRPDFGLTAQNAPAVAEVCVRLDGLPLALELAAARLKLLPPQALLVRLGSRLDILGDGTRDRPSRHNTLRAALAWSHDLLSAGEQRLLRRLAVFVGGWTLAAAEIVCDPDSDPAVDVLDGIAALVDQSLVRVAEAPDGEPRYTMLETIREYASERLVASGEAAEIPRRHAEYFLALAEGAAPEFWRSEVIAAPNRLEAEHENLRAALAWSQNEVGGSTTREDDRAAATDMWLRLVGALGSFWGVRGYFNEGRRWLEQALAARGWTSASARAWALNRAGWLARLQNDHDRATAFLEESRALYRDFGDKRGMAAAARYLGEVAQVRGDYARARPLLEEHLALLREVGDRRDVARGLACLALLARDQGQYERAAAILEESLDVYRSSGALHGIAGTLRDLASVMLYQGRYERAIALSDESLDRYRDLNDKRGIAWSLCHRGQVALVQRNGELAAALYGESLPLLRQLGDRAGIAPCLEGLAGVAGQAEEAERAARLFGSAEALREAIENPLSPAEGAGHEAAVVAARSKLPEEAFTAAWAAGRAMPLEQAIEYALTLPEHAPDPAALAEQPAGNKPSDPLSPREREVAVLVARGLTDAQLAEALIIGRRTAEKHVANCLGKLGLASRAGLAAWAVDRGLSAPRSD